MLESRTVHLPSALCDAVEQRFGSRFGGLEQFLAFVLQELLREEAARMDETEQRVIEDRLRDLGYI